MSLNILSSTCGPKRLVCIWPEVCTQLSKKQKEKEIEEWAEECAKLQAARRNGAIYEVLTGGKDYSKVTADARLHLEKVTALALPYTVREHSRGIPQSRTVRYRKHSENTWISLPKWVCGKLSVWPGTQASFHSRSYEDARSDSRRG